MDSNKILSNSNQMNNNTGLKNSNNQSAGRIMSSNVINSNNTIGAMNSKSSLVSPTMIQPDNTNMSEKRPSITAEELTPIVLNQLQTATKLRGDGSRKFRRGSSRSSQSSTPQKQSQSPGHRSGSAGAGNTAPTTPRSASAASNGVAYDNATAMTSGREHGKGGNGIPSSQTFSIRPNNNCHFESESESSCGEESRLRTAEAFMSGIQSAIQEKENNSTRVTPKDLVANASSTTGSGLSKELVGEVDSVLSKLMSQLQQGDPSLIPLITNLQTSLKTAANNPSALDSSNRTKNYQQDKSRQPCGQLTNSCNIPAKKQSPVVSELFGNESTYLSNIGTDSGGGGGEQAVGGSKIPWKIRAARKRALKHHTTGMTKDEFAQIKQSLTQAATTLPPKPPQAYPLARNKSEGTILSYASQMNDNDVDDNISSNVMTTTGIDHSMPSTYQVVEGNRAYGAVINSGRGCNLKGSVPTTSNPDCDGYSSDVCDYNVETGPSLALKPSRPNECISSSAKESQKPLENNISSNNNRFGADNSYVKPDQRDRPVSMADAARKDNSAQNVISSTDSEVPNVLSSDSEFGTRSRDRYKLSHQSSVDEISIDGGNSSRALRRSHSKSSTSGVQAKIARRKMMRQANAIDPSPLHLSSDQEMNTNDEEDSVEEKQDSEPINDVHSKKNTIGNSSSNISNQMEVSPKNNKIQNITEDPIAQELQSSEIGTQEQSTEIGKNTNWTSRFSNIKNSFASEEDLSKSRSPSINRSIPTTDEEQTKDRGRSKNKSSSPISASTKLLINPPAPEPSITEQSRISQLRERPPSKEDKNKLNTITASGNNTGLTPSMLSNVQASESIERSASAAQFLSPQIQPKQQSDVKKKNSAPSKLAVNQQQQQLPKSKQPTPNREPLTTSGRVSKSLPREGRSYNDQPREGRTYNDQSRAEVLGFVRSNRDSSEGATHSKNSDMDYQEYMNIINRVRRTKEFSRVRTEQYKLASMYAKEKKRQEELKLEEERLQRERIKIESEQKSLEEQQGSQHLQRNPIIASTSNDIPKSNSGQSNRNTTNQLQPSNTSFPIVNMDDNKNPQVHGIEKGELDNHESEQRKTSPPPTASTLVKQSSGDTDRSSINSRSSNAVNSTPIHAKTPNHEHAEQGNRRSATIDDQYHQEQLRLHNLRQEQAKQEQMRLEQIQLEQKRQQELRENQVRAEQEKLEKLREEQERQEKEREEIRRLEFERLQQIQEDQLRLEEERHRQQEKIRLEQMRLEEERKRQERIQAEKNALYNRQRLDMEAQNIAMNEEDRVIRDRQKQKMFTPQNEIETLSPQEKIIQERLMQQDKLRQEHRKEEAQIRQEKLNLIQQEESLITKQEEMLRQIETEREKLRNQEDKIRAQQQDRLQNVRQEKLLLEKQEEMLFMRKEQLTHERIKQEALRDEQRLLREQEDAIKKRQEQICKELMGEIVDENDKANTSAVGHQLSVNQSNLQQGGTQMKRDDNKLENTSDLYRPVPTKSVLSQDEYGFGNTTNTSTDATRNDNGTHTTTSTASIAPHTVSSDQSNSLLGQEYAIGNNMEVSNEGCEEEEEGVWSGSGSGSEDDTLDEDGYYESKVEVKQSHTSVPTTVRTIETKIDNPPWAPITPYLTYSEKQNVQTQEEVSAIFSQSKTKPHYPGVVTSPESLRTSTNLITTPESSISQQSQISHTPLSQTSSGPGSSPPPIPPLPKDDMHTNDGMAENFYPLQPEVPPRDDSFKVTAVYTSGSENAVYHTAGMTEKPKQSLLEVPSQVFANEGSASPQSPRIGGPGSAFKPYASSENLFDPSNLPRKLSDEGSKSELSSDPHQNYPLQNGNSAKYSDSRYFMRNQNGKEEFRPPLHGKVRDLRKATIKPFSTTDTEPEMRECNLVMPKKGRQKVPVYSTSETEEEYQAYLRSKPKWHGKGGHKDSWDPLLIQSPPQITQRPVGIIQRPKAQNATMPNAPPVIERGVQIDNSHLIYGNYFNNPVVPFDSSMLPIAQKNDQQQEKPIFQASNELNQSSNLAQQIDHSLIKQNINLQKDKMEQEFREKEAERQRKEQEILRQKQREDEEKLRLENERKRLEEVAKLEKEKKIREEKQKLEIENERKRQEDIERKRKIEEEIIERQRKKQEEQNQLEEKKRLEAKKDLESTNVEKTPTNQRKHSDGIKISGQTSNESAFNKEITRPVTQQPLIKVEESHPQLPLKKAGPLQQLNSYERIQKSDSIIELREKEQASKSSDQGPKSRSVRDLSKAFLDQSQNIIPQSVAEINRNSFLSTNDPKENVKEPSPVSPKVQRSNELSVTSPQYDSTSSNGLENDDLDMVHSPVISRFSTSPRVPLSPNSSQGSIVTASQSSVMSDSKRPSRSKFNNTERQKPSARHQSNPRKEMHDKLMNEALLQVEAKKEKAKPKQPVTRMNPTIAAMEIMTRKEIKMGEMEQRIARGELPQIPVPATPVHMKDQQNKVDGVKNVGGQVPFNKQQGRSNFQHPGQAPDHGNKSTSENLPPVILLKKQPKRLDPDEIKARKTSNDKSAGSQDEKSIKSPTTEKKSLQTEKSPQQPTQITNKVALAISAVKAKVIPPKDKSKHDTVSTHVKKNSVDLNTVSVASATNLPSEKSKQTQSTDSLKKKASISTSSKRTEAKSIINAQATDDKKVIQPEKVNNSIPTAKVSPSQVNTTSQPLQVNNQPNRQVAEVKPMQMAQTLNKKQSEQTKLEEDSVQENEVRNETVKRAAEKFEMETLKANERGRSSRTFGAFRGERSKSIGHNLGQRITTDIEDAEYEEDYAPTSSSMLPWANDSNIGNGSTPAVVRKRNAMRAMGAYQLRMSKSSDSITAAKLLAEARMMEAERNEYKNETSRHHNGRQNYHQQKALRINAQNYGGVGGRGEMSKSIEKQIDVYTKTREDIRRILDVAKKCSVAQRVKLLDSQQIDTDTVIDKGTDKTQEVVVGTQVSGGLKSREEKAEAIRREILEAKALAKKQAEEEAIIAHNEEVTNSDSREVKILSPVDSKVKSLKMSIKPNIGGSEDTMTQNKNSLGVPGSELRINKSSTTKSGESGSGRVGRSSQRRCVNFDNVVKRSKSCGGEEKEAKRTSLDMENIASVKSRIETYLTSAAQVAPPTIVEQTPKPMINPIPVKQPKSILVNRSESMSGRVQKIPKLIHNGEGNSKNLKIYAQSATDISAGEEDASHHSNRETNKLRFSHHQDSLLKVPKPSEDGMLLGGVKKSKSFATPGQFECAMDDRQIDEKRKTMMAFFTSQTTTIPFDQNSHKFGSKATRKISQPAMHIHAGGNGDTVLRNTEHVRGRNTKRSSVTSISDEILGDEDLRDVDAVFESLLTSTFSENESSSSISGPKSASRINKKDKQVKSGGARKAEVGKSSSMGGEKIGKIREENEGDITSDGNTTSLSSQTRKSKNASVSNRKSSSVTRKPSKSKLVAGEVKLSAIPASVEEHMLSSSTRSEKQKSNLQIQHQQKSVDVGGCDEREKVSKDKNLKSDHRKSSSENQEGLKTDMYKKSSIPADPLGSLPTSHTKKYLPRQQTWAGPQGSTPPPQISPSPTQSEYESCDQWEDY